MKTLFSFTLIALALVLVILASEVAAKKKTGQKTPPKKPNAGPKTPPKTDDAESVLTEEPEPSSTSADPVLTEEPEPSSTSADPVTTPAPTPSSPSAPGKVKDCKRTMEGVDYAGPLNVTRSGLVCQRWDSNKPHSSDFINSTNFPEGSATAAGNRCRNPNNSTEGPWCYTKDPKHKLEFCAVKFCGEDTDYCKMSVIGVEYAGPLNVTRDGVPCQRWDSDTPHPHAFMASTNFPERDAEAAGNKCRNPDNNIGGPWCYTTVLYKEKEYCDLRLCGVSEPGSRKC